MKAIPPDSLAYYSQFGDGADSTGGKAPMKTFTGTVTGNFGTIITNELGNLDSIPLSGIYVVLFDRDKLNDDFLGFAFTDNVGNYSITYSSNQYLEGNSLELFLEFRSHTSDTYKIISSNGWGNPYRVVTYQWDASQNAGTMIRNYVLSNDAFRENEHPAAFRVTHWAYNGYRYFDEQALPLGVKLRANINAVGSFYNPYGLPLLGNLSWPTINIDYDSDGTESTTYHEFGHHTMYRLQDNHFMLPHGTNGYHHTWGTENTSKLAWVEGWANFIGMVLDGVYWNEDNEYGRKGGNFTERRTNYGTITNGYRSEYYFGCALYDLWDGSNKGLPNVLLDRANPIFHSWNDTLQGDNGWQTLDDVELSFQDICFPLQESDYPNRIHTYYQNLINHITDNTLKSDIARVFRENRVQWNVLEYQQGWHNTAFGTDDIYIEETYEENPSGILWGPYTDTYKVNYYNKNGQNQFSVAGGSITNPKPILDNLYLGIWDTINRTANLNIPQSNFATYGQNRIFLNNGSLNLGFAPTRTALLEENDNSVICIREHGLLNIDAGSKLEVKPGGSFIVQSGGTIQVHGNGKVLFKTGSYVCIGDNVNIILHDAASTIEFETGVNMGLAPDILDFQINQSCHIPPTITFTGNGTIQYNCTDYATFTHTSDYIVNYNNVVLNGQNYSFKKNIIIEPGYSLTLNYCNLQFSKYSKVIVKPGAKLIVNYSNLNKVSVCNEQWLGIEVWGNKNANQFPDANGNYQQGYLELNDATIENAISAVELWKPDDYSKTGGIIKATNSTFRNNTKSIHALHYKNTNPYHPEWEMDYRGTISNCIFEITPLYIPTNTFYKHIDLAKIRGFSFSGSDFSLSPFAQGVSEWNQAIAAYSSGFKVQSPCNSSMQPCNSYDTCRFTGFRYGIFANNALSQPNAYYVNHAKFSNNIYGIYTDDIDNPVILNSDFRIGYNNSQGCPSVSGYGISLVNSGGFAIEENKFKKQVNSPVANYTGISIDNSAATEEVYKNDFSGLSYANYSKYMNTIPANIWEGLSYWCNTNTNNYADFYVYGTPEQQQEGIQSKQGDDYTVAGNTFSQSGATWHFYNGGDHLVGYYYNVNSPSQNPDDTKIYNVIDKGINLSNQCPSHYGGTTPAYSIVLNNQEKLLREEQYAYNLSNYNAVKSLYDNLKDGGSTEEKIADIETAQPQDMWALRADLLGSSPYLSEEVLKKVADKTTVFTESAIFDILAANPDELKKEELLKYLEDKENPLPDYMIEILRQLATGETYKTVLEKQMAMYNREKSRAANDMIRSYLNDTILDNNALRGWLNNLGGIEADKQIISTYIQEDNYTDAFSLANMLPQLYNLSGDALAAHDQYVQILNLYKTLYNENREITELKDPEKDMLFNFANNSSDDAGSLAKGILTAYYNIPFIDCFELNEQSALKKGSVNPSTLARVYGMEISVKPNPASIWAAFDYKLPEGETSAILTITEPNGKVIEMLNLTGNQGQKLWDTRHLSAGTYFYQMSCSDKSLSGKLVVVK